MIPNKKIPYGASSAMSHSYKLYMSTKFLYDNNNYRSSIILGIFALEELGKHMMLFDKHQKGEDISNCEWDGKFKNHKYKITAVIDQYRSLSTITKIDRIMLDKIYERLPSYLDLKSSILYVKWGSKENAWHDLHIDEKENAQFLITLLDFFLNGYLIDTGSDPDIIHQTPDQINILLKKHKIEGYCTGCETIIKKPKTLCVCNNYNKNVQWRYCKSNKII